MKLMKRNPYWQPYGCSVFMRTNGTAEKRIAVACWCPRRTSAGGGRLTRGLLDTAGQRPLWCVK